MLYNVTTLISIIISSYSETDTLYAIKRLTDRKFTEDSIKKNQEFYFLNKEYLIM